MNQPEVINAAERAVRNAQATLGMDSSTARELVRVEIDRKTTDEILAWARPGFMGEVIPAMKSEAPIKIRDVSYYLIPNAPVPWRVIAPAGKLGGGFDVAVSYGNDREHEFDESSKR